MIGQRPKETTLFFTFANYMQDSEYFYNSPIEIVKQDSRTYKIKVSFTLAGQTSWTKYLIHHSKDFSAESSTMISWQQPASKHSPKIGHRICFKTIREQRVFTRIYKKILNGDCDELQEEYKSAFYLKENDLEYLFQLSQHNEPLLMHLIKHFGSYLSTMAIVLDQLRKERKNIQFEKVTKVLRKVMNKSDAGALVDLFSRKNCFNQVIQYVYGDRLELKSLWTSEKLIPKPYFGESFCIGKVQELSFAFHAMTFVEKYLVLYQVIDKQSRLQETVYLMPQNSSFQLKKNFKDTNLALMKAKIKSKTRILKEVMCQDSLNTLLEQSIRCEEISDENPVSAKIVLFVSQVMLILENVKVEDQGKYCDQFYTQPCLLFLEKTVASGKREAYDLLEAYSKQTPIRFLLYLLANESDSSKTSIISHIIRRQSQGDELAFLTLFNMILNMKETRKVWEFFPFHHRQNSQFHQQNRLQKLLGSVMTTKTKELLPQVKLALISLAIKGLSHAKQCLEPQKLAIKLLQRCHTSIVDPLLCSNYLCELVDYLKVCKPSKKDAVNVSPLLQTIFQIEKTPSPPDLNTKMRRSAILRSKLLDVCLSYLVRNLKKQNMIASSMLSCFKILESFQKSTQYHFYIAFFYAGDLALLKTLPKTYRFGLEFAEEATDTKEILAIIGNQEESLGCLTSKLDKIQEHVGQFRSLISDAARSINMPTALEHKFQIESKMSHEEGEIEGKAEDSSMEIE